MRFTTSSIMAIALLVPSTLASALPVAEAELVAFNVADNSLEKRNPGSWCCAEPYDIGDKWIDFHLFTRGWGNEPDGCHKGLLDNIRGQCGSVVGWECKRLVNSRGVQGTYAKGLISFGGFSKCLENAIWLASPKNNREVDVKCGGICAKDQEDM